MFTVKVEDILRAAKVGRDNGTVAAFNDTLQNVGMFDCAYRYPGFPGVGCAIGVGIPDDVAEIIMKDGLGSATVKGLQGVLIEFDGDIDVLTGVQERHDAILNAMEIGKDPASKIKAFDSYLNKQLALLPAAA